MSENNHSLLKNKTAWSRAVSKLTCGIETLGRQTNLSAIEGGLKGVRELFLPSRCSLCRTPCEMGYCHLCQHYLPWIAHGCQQCGTTLASGFLCGHCQRSNSLWKETIVPFHYIDPISEQIHALKYQARLSVVSPLSRMLASTVIKRSTSLPDMIVPVPLHSGSLRKRGYNQSALIARELGALLGVPVRENAIVKIRATESQTQLNHSARQANVAGAFKVVQSVKGKSIALVDDVITSGATMSEACKGLCSEGGDQISIWAIAKTPIEQ